MGAAVLTEGLTKHFGSITAVKGIDFAVEEGSIVGLLGPNGAGKTTTIRMLCTLLAPTSGHATVAGFDIVRDAQAVRSIIGLTGQYAAVDDDLTGRENLVLCGRLVHLRRAEAAAKADELLVHFDLADAADRTLKTYSGGMRRRLDLAASLVGTPAVLFLDEPTTGLDPRSRIALWDVIEKLKASGTTIVLTTQYLEEADRLTERISVIDDGQIIAEGTSDELKTQVGGDVLELAVGDNRRTAEVGALLGQAFTVRDADIHTDAAIGSITLPVSGGAQSLIDAVRILDASDIAIADIALRRPSLDDVFLALTGHGTEDQPDGPPTARRRRASN
ncbi:MAG: ATP-binding cassette domain-containing protein [Acidimicrobiales bacterium]